MVGVFSFGHTLVGDTRALRGCRLRGVAGFCGRVGCFFSFCRLGVLIDYGGGWRWVWLIALSGLCVAGSRGAGAAIALPYLYRGLWGGGKIRGSAGALSPLCVFSSLFSGCGGKILQ